MDNKKFVAYVGTYTHGSSKGIHIYDLDVENGRMEERKVIPINNPSYIKKSHNGKYLYSIADEGVRSFEILPDGDLRSMNSAPIDGMRGCYLSTDKDDKYLFVGGWHDGRVTVLRLHPDGTVGEITDGIFHKGLGSVAERNFRPHVNCVNLTPDGRFLCAVDLGVDQIKIYKFNPDFGKIQLVDMLHCELESAPRIIKFSRNGRFAYVISELKNYITVYEYDGSGKTPEFNLIQKVPTRSSYHSAVSAASALRFSRDDSLVLCTNAGDNSAGIFRVDKDTGLLTKICILPVSGDYPKAIDFFPDNRHIMSLNHESNTITIFRVNYEKGYFSMWGAPIPIETPNCILVSELP
ncbi:MAG: lactonase family protein [Lachnospiraceae bacterium]|nr:lactonase family protein [Lachnospiraceae bacterium]